MAGTLQCESTQRRRADNADDVPKVRFRSAVESRESDARLHDAVSEPHQTLRFDRKTRRMALRLGFLSDRLGDVA